MSFDRVEMDDLLAFYPFIEEEEIQNIITAKHEFNELATDPFETLSKLRGEYFKHQLFTERFLRAYDEELIFHEPGTGKTCAMTAAAEWFKKARLRGETHIKKALFLVKNDTLETQLANDIVCRCTENVYDTSDIISLRSRKAQKIRINKKLRSWYEISTYKTFAIRLSSMSNEQIQDSYSNTIVFIDEAHNLRFTPETKKKIDKRREEQPLAKEKFGSDKTYVQIWRFFHLIRNSKKILATATPMVEDVNEIRDLMNLLLPADGDISRLNFQRMIGKDLEDYVAIKSDFDFEEASDKELERIFRGRVSYVRTLDTGIDIQEMGSPVNEELEEGFYETQYGGHDFDPQSRVYISAMKEKQRRAYLRAIKERKNELRLKERFASNFIYPDGSWGLEGFEKYVEDFSGLYIPNEELSSYISTLDGISNLGIKFADIITLTNDVEGGNVFIYCNYTAASGAIPLSLCFEAQGYERFSEIGSVFIKTGISGRQPYCSGDITERSIQPSFLPTGAMRSDGTPQPPRYAIFVGGASSTENYRAMMELMNSPENKHGDYIKVFITSQKGKEGISVNNVVSIHVLDADWKQASTYQALSRAIRSTSHVDLLMEKRQQYLDQGLNPKDARVDVQLYQHAAYTTFEGKILSVDLQLYELSEVKDRKIKRIERMMKRVAVDCQINYARNVRETDVDGSAVCDYETCDYECWGPLDVMYEDYSTYDVYYMEEVTEKLTKLLKDVMMRKFRITIEEFLDLIKRHPDINIPPEKKYVDYAIVKLLIEIPLFQDRYGRKVYLNKDGDTLFLTLDHPQPQHPHKLAIHYYTSHLIGNLQKSLGSITKSIKIPIDTVDLQNLGEYSFNDLKRILEQAIANKDTRANRKILDIFAGSTSTKEKSMPSPRWWFSIPRPESLISKVENQLLKKKGGQGRKPKSGIRKPKPIKYYPGIEDEEGFFWDEDTPTVYFHTLASLDPQKTKSGRVAKFDNMSGPVRIYDAGLDQWRDATLTEQVVYSLWAQKELYRFKEPFEAMDLYGFYLNEDKGRPPTFRIRNKIGESDVKNDRSKNRGIVCGAGIKGPEMIQILETLDISPPAGTHISPKESREKILIETLSVENLKEFILNTKGFQHLRSQMEEKSREDLVRTLSWIESGISTLEKCRLIQKALKKRNGLYKALPF